MTTPNKVRPVLRAAPPSHYIGEGAAMSARRAADRFGNKFLNHWFVEAQVESALPELRDLSHLLSCNAEDWGKEEFAANCLKTALGLSRQAEQVWPGLYQLAALIKERGYYTQDIESWELKKTLHGCDTFEQWFCKYVHPSFEAFTRMEEQFKLAEQTGAPLPRTINLDGLAPGAQVQVAQAAGGYAQAAAVQEGLTAPVGRPKETADNVRSSSLSNEGGNGGVQTYRKIQKLARGGNAEAAELLDQIDRGETTPHAAYVALGLRRPQISAQLEPGLHDQLMAWTESTGDTVREVVESALEMFFRRMGRLETQAAPAPAAEPLPVVIAEPPAPIASDTVLDLVEETAPSSSFWVNERAAAPAAERQKEPEPEPSTAPDPGPVQYKPSKGKYSGLPLPDAEWAAGRQLYGGEETSGRLGYSRPGLEVHCGKAFDRGDMEVVVPAKNGSGLQGRRHLGQAHWIIEEAGRNAR